MDGLVVGAELQCELENHFLPEGLDDFCLPICSSVLRTWLRVLIRTGNGSPRQLHVSRSRVSMGDGQL